MTADYRPAKRGEVIVAKCPACGTVAPGAAVGHATLGWCDSHRTCAACGSENWWHRVTPGGVMHKLASADASGQAAR